MSSFTEPTGLGATIFQDRYAKSPEETWPEACRRVADHIAAAEENEKSTLYSNRFFDQLVTNRFCPGGRIWYGAGRPKAQLSNCFVIGTADSREGWARTVGDVIIISGLMGGVGVNVSPIRPRGSLIHGTGGVATGAVSLMQLINDVGNVIVGGGGRRMALMLCLDITHPDLEEFLDAKLDLNQLNNANISVVLPQDLSAETFVSMVRNDEQIDLVFNGVSSGKTFSAAKLWDRLVENSWKNGEPGVLNAELANRMSNIGYHAALTSTNPCQPAWATVLTPMGISTIGELSVGDLIWSETGWTTVVGKVSSGVKDVHAYRTTAGVFYGTENHRVISQGKKVEAGAATSIDQLAGPRVDAAKIDPQDVMDGLHIGDGSVHAASSNLVYLLIGKDDSDYFSSEIADLIVQARPGITDEAYVCKTSVTAQELPSLPTRTIPDRFFRGPPSVAAGFLRGIYSANGSVVAKGRRITLKTSSPVMLEQVQVMLSSLGIRSYFTTNQSHAVEFSNGTYTCKESYDLNITKDRERFLQLIGFIQEYKTKKVVLTTPGANKTSYEIKSNELVSTEEVFDITVDNATHTYWTNGMNVANCGEIFMSPGDSCNLGALVLPRFVDDGKFDWDLLDESVRLGIRFLDDMLSVNYFPTQEIQQTVNSLRRLGLGVMGLHSMLLELGLNYDSAESFAFVDRLFSTIKNTAYDASINLAIEKTPFPAYDHRFLDGGFARTLKRGIRNKIKEHGIRNCAVMTIAPTGTTSMISGVSSGIEPLPPAVYWRNYYKNRSDGRRELKRELVVEESFYKYPDLIQSAIDIPVRSHFEMQKTVQRHLDNACSKTINLPNDFPKDEFGDIWLEYLPYLKGTTIYRYGSRENEPINPVPREQWDEVVAQEVVSEAQASVEEQLLLDCPTGVCELKK
jgi:ribonucleoside-diphosphate reductase alpha chain